MDLLMELEEGSLAPLDTLQLIFMNFFSPAPPPTPLQLQVGSTLGKDTYCFPILLPFLLFLREMFLLAVMDVPPDAALISNTRMSCLGEERAELLQKGLGCGPGFGRGRHVGDSRGPGPS